MSKAYIDKGKNDEETVYSINLLSEAELSMVITAVKKLNELMKTYLQDHIEISQTKVLMKERYTIGTELVKKLTLNP